MAHSIYTSRIVSYVEAHPACSKWDVASFCTRNRMRCPSKQYYLPNTQIRMGHIVARRRGRAYQLFASSLAMHRWDALALTGLSAETPTGVLADRCEEMGDDGLASRLRMCEQRALTA